MIHKIIWSDVLSEDDIDTAKSRVRQAGGNVLNTTYYPEDEQATMQVEHIGAASDLQETLKERAFPYPEVLK